MKMHTLIIFEITDQAYFPYLSSLLIKLFKSTLSALISIFFEGKYLPDSKLIASKILI